MRNNRMTESRIYALCSMQNVHSKWQDRDDLPRWRREGGSGPGGDWGLIETMAGLWQATNWTGVPRTPPQRNAIKYRINTGAGPYMTGGEARDDKEGDYWRGPAGVNITRRDQSHQRERRRLGQCY